MTRDLAARLVPPAPKGSAAGPARYDPVMLLTVWMYAYLRGVLSTRAVEDRCRYDATFRVACGRAGPGPYDVLPVPQAPVRAGGLAEDLFYRVLHVCACAGLGRLSRGGRRRGQDRRERVEGGQPDRGRAAQARRAGDRGRPEGRRGRGGGQDVLPGTDLLLGAETAPGPDPRSRAGRVLACLEDLQGEREAAEARPASRGRPTCRRWRPAPRTAGPRPRWPWPRSSCGWRRPSPAQQAALADWQARRAAGQRVTPRRRPGPAPARRPARPAPAWRNCRPRPPRRRAGGSRPGTGRSQRRGATSPTRTPGCCRSAAAGSSRATTARTPPPMTG